MNKNLTKQVFFFVTALGILLLIFRFFFVFKYPPAYADNGHLDCSDYSYEDFICSLNGEWEDALSNQHSYVSFPECLTAETDDTHSYSLTVKLPKGDQLYSIIVPPTNGSYEIIINGGTIFSTGIFNPTDQNEYIDYLRFHPFYAYSDTVIITINYRKNSDTILKHINIGLGSINQGLISYLITLTPDIIFCAIFTMSVLYFFTISIREGRRKVYFSIAQLCLFILIHVMLTNTCLLGLLFPKLPIVLENIISHMIRPVILISLIYHFNQNMPDIISQNIFLTYTIGVLLHMIFVAILPETVSYILYGEYVLIVVALIIILTYAVNKMLHLRPHLFFIFLLAALSVSLGLIIDIIRVNSPHYSYSDYGLPYFFSIFIIIVIIRFLQKDKEIFEQEHELMVSYKNTLYTKKTEETNFLSAHLKPHFLFNALNIISGYALFEPQKAIVITKAFIVYLHQLFEHDNLNEMNSVKNEIQLANAFGFIEAERFPNINIEYDVDKNIPDDYMIPSLCLQPLLENAVNHGIRKKPSKFQGHILMSVKLINNNIEFTIKDNGKGADKATIEKALSKPDDNKYHCLYHLNLRLNELYNEQLCIESIPDEGTTVTFKIPVR